MGARLALNFPILFAPGVPSLQTFVGLFGWDFVGMLVLYFRIFGLICLFGLRTVEFCGEIFLGVLLVVVLLLDWLFVSFLATVFFK
jgi:hypothetical protein